MAQLLFLTLHDDDPMRRILGAVSWLRSVGDSGEFERRGFDEGEGEHKQSPNLQKD